MLGLLFYAALFAGILWLLLRLVRHTHVWTWLYQDGKAYEICADCDTIKAIHRLTTDTKEN